MYRIRLEIVAFLLATLGLQAQEGFYYQAVIKNTDGSPLKETPVKIRIRIIEGTTTLQYEEEKEVTTSREGFVSFIIGEGATTDFTSINWQGELYLQDEIDTGTGYGAPTRMPLLKTPRSYISDRAISVLDNSITSASILDGTISNDDLSAAASISFSKLSISASDIEGLGFLQSDENFTSALKTKLDGIEAGAQVTDATNVEAAGALMDSEITNLADVKAFDPADYATAAQGALADGALQAASNLSDLVSAADARTNLGLAIGTDVQAYNATVAAVAGGNYTGDDTITEVGTISSGTWNGTAIADGYIASAATWNAIDTAVPAIYDNSGTPAINTGITKAEVQTLLNIEDGATADQTQADINGLAITEVGTISSGTWNGTAIAITHGGTGATTASAARNSLGIYSGVYNLTVNGASEVIPIANLIGLSALNQSATIVFHSNESGLVVIQSVLEDSDLNSTLDSIRVIFSANSSIGDKISYIIIP